MATEDIEITGAGETAEAEPLSAAATLTYPLAPGYNVNVRSGPGTHYPVVRTLPAGSSIPIRCQCPGESVTGPYGTSKIWDNIANAQFVSDAYVKTGTDGYVAVRCS
ncbi:MULTISPECIES: peptidase [unclassified Streptomyces]|uniref:peptidase n=1 Tax=unclassified Streptomyces TaxID=2593676 RepID=UPI002E81DB65|nr:peptidase [Streptomyces sp. NBC_00589]WTI37229.1 peptidase [Streptomyces sp. NBC_00775]WUB29095.1 peptidase [Streptomyces sp. NBC_00589]